MSQLIYWIDEKTFNELESKLEPMDRFTNTNLADWNVPNRSFSWDSQGPDIVLAKAKEGGKVDELSPYHRERLDRIIG